MYISHQQEAFSTAFVRTIAASAGLIAWKPEPDIDKIDLGLGRPGRVRSRIEIQLKSLLGIVQEPDFPYELDVETFENLRDPDYSVPRVLVVVVSPKDIGEWVSVSTACLEARFSAYWLSLEGEPETANKSTKTVRIPTSNLLTPESLTALLDRIADGERP